MILVASLLVIISLLYLGIVLFLLQGLLSIRPPEDPQGMSYSVVIAARNEQECIGACLDSVLGQRLNRERFEVIVVDDRSTDGTHGILEQYATHDERVTAVHIDSTPPDIAPKKYAVSRGVEAAKNEVIVCTDADCVVPSTWLETIDRYFTPETGLVQGITSYYPQPDISPILFGLQAIDFLSHGIVAASAIGAGLPLNSNANNFAFRKDAFYDVGGYDDLRSVISGDDDLLLQRIVKSEKWHVRFMAKKEGAVSTRPTATLRGILNQRKRWASKTVHYNSSQVALLSVIFLFYLCIPSALLLAFFDSSFGIAALGMGFLKILGESMLMIPGTRIFGQTDLRRYLIPASILQLPVVLWSVIGGVFGSFHWKDTRFQRKMNAEHRQGNRST